MIQRNFWLEVFLIGFFYSSLLPITGPRFIHFLLGPTLFHAVYFGFLFLTVGLIGAWLLKGAGITVLSGVLSGAVGLHFSLWLYGYSYLASSFETYTVVVALLGGAVLSGVVFSVLLYRGSRWVPVCLLVFAIGFRVLTVYVPGPFVGRVVTMPDKEPFGELVSDLFYPSAAPLEEHISRYPFLVGRPDLGKKLFVIVIDAFREDFFGASLSGVDLTPNLSRLGEEHFYFSNYRVQAPRSKASVASFFTGKYPRNHGTYDFGPVQGMKGEKLPGPFEVSEEDYVGHALPSKFHTLAERLNEGGFHNTGVVTIGHILNRYNYGQGFHHYENAPWPGVKQDLYVVRRMLFGLLRNNSSDAFYYLHFAGAHFPYYQGKKNTRFWSQTPYFRNGEITFDDWELDSLEEMIQKPAKNNVRENFPEEVEFLEHLYGSSINYYDLFVVPKILESLKRLGVFENSMLMITSDHGENLFDSEQFYGHGHTLREHTINVPLLLKLPDSLDSGATSEQSRLKVNVESVDLTATILDVAGASREGIDGHSFLPHLTNKKQKNWNGFREAFAERLRYGAVREVAAVDRSCKYVYRYREGTGDFEIPCSEKTGDEMENLIFESLGYNDTINDTSAVYTGVPETESEKLEGLGYF